MPKRVFVVEDHEVFRGVLIDTLNEIKGVEVCGFSGSAELALGSLPETKPDLALVDVSLPKMDGFDLAAEIKRRCPGTRCVMLSGYLNQTVVGKARNLGLEGYVEKGDSGRLKKAILDVFDGKTYFPKFDS